MTRAASNETKAGHQKLAELRRPPEPAQTYSPPAHEEFWLGPAQTLRRLMKTCRREEYWEALLQHIDTVWGQLVTGVPPERCRSVCRREHKYVSFSFCLRG